MHPELFTLPGGITIKTYGFFLAVGFLSAVWLAMRRASRVKADPDRVLDLSFLALIFGVAGSRLFFVIHYWEPEFAHRANKLWAIVDIRQGGLEFLGGLIGAAVAILVFAWWKRLSIRMYLDILAPSTMWGLAFGRLGCFFNGCCFGGVCLAADAQTARFPWAVEFPYGSNPFVHQWEEREVFVPAELVDTRGLYPSLVPAKALSASVEQREGPEREVEQLNQRLEEARKSGADAATIQGLEQQLKAAQAKKAAAEQELGLDSLAYAQKFPSRDHPDRVMSVSELQALAARYRSLPVHPTQLYSSIHALILSGLLSAVFYTRKRHGMVFGLMLLLYPIGRVLLEIIRTDNPHDVGGLTISQFTGLSLALIGVVYLLVVYRALPERSPLAVPVVREETEQ